MKICSKCKFRKPVQEFAKDKYKNDGLCGQCKQCQKERKDIVAKPKREAKLMEKELAEASQNKVCSKCGQEKRKSEYFKVKDGYRPECKECAKKRNLGVKIRSGWKPQYVKHGLKDEHIGAWYSWRNMKARCYIPSVDYYECYGGRGIKVCCMYKGVYGFPNFLHDLGDRPEGMSVDRIDVNGHYSCGKCQECLENNWSFNLRWATNEEQANNQRSNILVTLEGKTQTLTRWVREKNLSWHTVVARIHQQGMSPEDALTKPTARGRLISIENETKNISDWARFFKTNRRKIYSAMDKLEGKTFDEIRYFLRERKFNSFKE